MAMPLRFHPGSLESACWISKSLRTAMPGLLYGCKGYFIVDREAAYSHVPWQPSGEHLCLRIRPESGSGKPDIGKHRDRLDGISKADLRIDFFAQVFPDGIRHLQEHRYHLGIKLPAGEPCYLIPSNSDGLGSAIGTIGGNRV